MFTDAAEKGHAAAQLRLGAMYNNGEGVLQDYKEALKWYLLAAEQGNNSAQNNLGLMYEYGDGVIQDKVYAHMWYNIAASQGKKKAIENRDSIDKEMTASQIEEAQRLARQCQRNKYKGC